MVDEKKYRVVIIITFVVLLAIGLYIGFQVSTDKGSNTQNEIANNDIDEVDVYEETPVVSSKTTDVEVIYENYYSICAHKEIRKDMIYGIALDKLKEDELKKQKSNNEEYELSEEKKDSLHFKRTLNQYCPNHFNVKLENGEINVYRIVNDGVETLERTIDISQELIRQDLLEELNLGIKVNSKSELNLLIEDIES